MHLHTPLLTLTLSTLTLAFPHLSPRQDSSPSWSFTVYQSLQQCTGAADTYNGTSSQECTKGIRNGSFGSFTINNISEGCSIGLYDTDDCAIDTLIGVLTSETSKRCQQAALERANVPGFDVQCK
jgi:hypothetical protein